MLDTCTIAHPRPQSEWTVNETTGVLTVTYSAAKYTGKCKVQSSQAQEANPEAGGAVFTVQRYAVHIPVASCVPAVGDVITITAAALDANLAGRQFRVVALLHKTAATAYRLAVEVV